MGKVQVAVSIALTLVLAGCKLPPAIPTLPSKGGPAWVEVTSAHFTVWTDSPERARGLIQVMEQLREVVYGTALFGGATRATACS